MHLLSGHNGDGFAASHALLRRAIGHPGQRGGGADV